MFKYQQRLLLNPRFSLIRPSSQYDLFCQSFPLNTSFNVIQQKKSNVNSVVNLYPRAFTTVINNDKHVEHAQKIYLDHYQSLHSGAKIESSVGNTKYTELIGHNIPGKSHAPINVAKTLIIDEPGMTLSLGGTYNKLAISFCDYTTHPQYLLSIETFHELSERRRFGDLTVTDEMLIAASKYTELPGYSDLPVIVIIPSMSHSINLSSLPSVRGKRVGMNEGSKSSTNSSTTTSTTRILSPGWWEDFVGSGPSYGVNTDIYRVIIADNLGGPFGSSGPLALKNPLQSGSHLFMADFPIITPIDQAVTHARLLEYLGLLQRKSVISSQTTSRNITAPCEGERPYRLIDYVKRNIPSYQTVRNLMECQEETIGKNMQQEINIQKLESTVEILSSESTSTLVSLSSPTSPQLLPIIYPRISFDPIPNETTGEFSKIHTIIGSSMGGMQALTLASLFPGISTRLAAFCCTTRTSPATVAMRSIQRTAVCTDPAWNEGNYLTSDRPIGPVSGMETARMVGTMSYRSRTEFDLRFDWNHHVGVQTEVESYLRYQASKFPIFYDANSYLILSKCMDLTGTAPSWEHYVQFIQRVIGTFENPTEVYLLGVEEDTLTPALELRDTAALIGSQGNVNKQKIPIEFEMISSIQGHDAFLTEKQTFIPRLQHFINAKQGNALGDLRSYIRSIEA